MKKKIAVVLSLAMLATTFIACGKKSDKTDLAKIKDKGEMVVGLDDTFVPMGFKDDNGDINGFDVDLANAVGEKLGVKVKFQPIDWTMKESELNGGKIDVIWNGYSITDERKEKVAFSKPYLENKQVIITLANSPIKTKADLNGKNVAAQNGSSAVDAVEKEADLVKTFKGGKLVTFETNNDALMDLEAGRVDAVVGDEILIRYYTNQRGESKYKVLDDNFGTEEYGIGFRKDDKEFLSAVQKALDELKADGTSKKISEKWFGKDIVKS
ncbi:amino acid ABC transporter substrate-binding protein [Clostridium paridis]|uniref:Amino acid ABC transporter substrate-binding protein n=1 Tax=Clostridium paridis TaxID=2803863 RepID=A0A937FH65_9CLOT|nr:amino acid ABC transporter substrate-binding protein [Clostridium paridis]MBL4931356.1 amino acid ABC transporter substrate-binding protein [Clostridium paridis]